MLGKHPGLWGGACAAVLAAAAAGGVAAAQSGGSAPRPSAGGGAVPHQAVPSVQRAAASSSRSPASRSQATPSAATPSAAAPATVPVVNIGSYSGRAPSEIDFSADGGNIVTRIRWQSWTGQRATGRGTSAIESCVPNCAQGPVSYVPATINLSVPLGGKFTVLTEVRKGHTLTLRYPVSWPLAAS